MTGRVVVLAAETSLTDGGRRLEGIVSLLGARGVQVECLVWDGGPGARRLASLAPTWSVHLGWEQAARSLLAPRDGTERLRGGAALRRWFAGRPNPAALFLDPVPAALLRRLPAGTRRRVGVVGPAWRPEVTQRSAADGWIVFPGPEDEAPRGAVTCRLPPLPLPVAAVPVRAPDPGGGALVLLGDAGVWSRADHTVEVAWHLAHGASGRSIRWVCDPGDEWYCRHDLAHAGLSEVVDVVRSDDEGALDGVGVVVRTGYGSAPVDLLLRAATASVPVCAFRTPDLPEAVPGRGPFDVEGLVEDVLQLCRDPELAARRGADIADRLAQASFDDEVDQLLVLLGLER